MAENMFLSIDGIEIEDAEEGDYTAYEEELGVSARMISGRRVEEVRATIWVVQVRLASITAEVMERLSKALKEKRQHQLFFLPSTGGSELASGLFHLVSQPTPTLTRWGESGPVWDSYKLTFEEIDGHD